MSNTLGKKFTLTTAGESHGPMLLAIVDGCPAGLALSAEVIQIELDRRKPGSSRQTSQRQESDHVQLASGVFEGKTTGTPIALLIPNEDARSRDYDALKDCFRPGHADYTYWKKYGVRDYRGGGRASARETASWVAAGAIAKKYLRERFSIQIRGYVSQIGAIKAEKILINTINQNDFYFPDPEKIVALDALIKSLRREGNSIGAGVTVMAENVPVGLGEPVFDKLDALIASAMISIPAAKGVEIGDGFEVITQKGSEHRDEMTPGGFLSNHAGGILGGISTGQTIMANIAFKPASSIRLPANTVDLEGRAVEVICTGRHDPCVGIRAVPVVEARLALVLMDAILQQTPISNT